MDKDAKCHGTSHANKNWLCFLCAAIHENPHSFISNIVNKFELE
jgi:hypothetical protein